MKRALNVLLHRIAWWASEHRWLFAVIYRYCCPCPLKDAQGRIRWSARGCFYAGNCGCDNATRYAALSTHREEKG